MKKLNSKGFGAVEVVLLVLLVGLIAGSGWYIWKSRQATDQSLNNTSTNVQSSLEASKQKQDLSVKLTKDGTEDWYLYKPPKGEYQMRLPDGWELQRYMKSSNFYAFSSEDIQYKKGSPAKVEEVVGGRDFASIGYFLRYGKNDDNTYSPRGIKQTSLKTKQGLEIKKYILTTTEEGGLAPPIGTKQYFYYVTKGAHTLSVQHDTLPGKTFETTYLEKSLQTLEFL